MKNLFEKIKQMSKSFLLSLVLVLAMTVVLCIGCGNEGTNNELNDNTQNEENTDNNESENQEDENADSNGEEDPNGNDSQGSEDEGNTEDENGDATGDSSDDVNGDTNGDTNGDSNSGDSSTDNGSINGDSGSEESDILGSGTADAPYTVIPDVSDDKMTVTTMDIPAGGTLYYDIQRVGGMILKIEDANAFVIDSAGNRYDAVNGVVTFEIEGAMASEFVSFQIGNKGGAADSFTIQFLNKTGSYANPTSISSLINNSYEIFIEEGNEVGHYYKYYAEKDGVIRFSIESITSGRDGAISVTNNRNSVNRNLEADGNGTYVEIEVQKGDELIITIGVLPDRRYKYKEADIIWHGEYAE